MCKCGCRKITTYYVGNVPIMTQCGNFNSKGITLCSKCRIMAIEMFPDGWDMIPEDINEIPEEPYIKESDFENTLNNDFDEESSVVEKDPWVLPAYFD